MTNPPKMNWTDSPEDNIRLALHRYGELTLTRMTQLFHHRVRPLARDKALQRMMENREITRVSLSNGGKLYRFTSKEDRP